MINISVLTRFVSVLGDQTIKPAAGLMRPSGGRIQKVPCYDQQQQLGPPGGRAGFTVYHQSLLLFSTKQKKTHISILYIVLYLNEMCFIFLYLELLRKKKLVLGGKRIYFQEVGEVSGTSSVICFLLWFFQLLLPEIVNGFVQINAGLLHLI